MGWGGRPRMLRDRARHATMGGGGESKTGYGGAAALPTRVGAAPADAASAGDSKRPCFCPVRQAVVFFTRRGGGRCLCLLLIVAVPCGCVGLWARLTPPPLPLPF